MRRRIYVLLAALGLLLAASAPIHADGGDVTGLGFMQSCSGTIATGGTAQNAITDHTGEHYRLILNPPSATESLWFSTTGSATANGEATGSIELKQGASFLWSQGNIPTNALSVVAATTGHKFTCVSA